MMKQTKRFGNLLIIVLLLGICLHSPLLRGADSPVSRQDTVMLAADGVKPRLLPMPVELVRSTLPFVIDSLCRVDDPKHTLDRFFSELEMLRQGKDTVISVVQLGDSHIQCGYLSGRVMRLFHEDFGNAGRGLIVPLKLTRTNEPDDYFICSTLTDWLKGRCVQRTPQCPIGLGGIGIKTMARKVNMDVYIGPNNGAGYEFNRAVMFRHPQATPLVATGLPSDSVKTSIGTEPLCPGVVCDTFRFNCQTDTLLLRSHTLPAKYNNLYYGLSLTNGRPGVLFHSVGVNGAMFVNYTDSVYLKQLALLKPSLLIISMGTNETFGRRFNAPEFRSQVARLVTLIQVYLPNTAIVLTTPPECFKRTWVNKKRVYQRNANTDIAARAIAGYAREQNIPCWDLYSLTGGKGSSKWWQSYKHFGRDRIHFTKETYREQGTLLYRALMKEYNAFASRQGGVATNVQPDSTSAYVIR